MNHVSVFGLVCCVLTFNAAQAQAEDDIQRVPVTGKSTPDGALGPSARQAQIRATRQQGSTKAVPAKTLPPAKATVGSRPNAAEDSVDLGSLDQANSVDLSAMGDSAGKGGGSPHHHAPGALGIPNFKIYFDLELYAQPGKQVLTFSSFHNFLFFELAPAPDLMFTFDVASIRGSPRYFELDYQLSKNLQLRLGKIWIPFDDTSPHTIYGGRVNVSLLSVGPPFLPDLWTELGAGIKYTPIDTSMMLLDTYLYVVNGFGANGTDPLNSGSPYPSFVEANLQNTDNNKDKAIGGRAHVTLFHKFGFGISYYTGRWSDDKDAARRLSILGMDAQIRFSAIGSELRAGIATMAVDFANGPFGRGGYYLEWGQKFGSRQQWKFLGRGGQIQLDDRVIAISDQKIIGGTLLWRPALIQWGVEYSRDLNVISIKNTYEYVALRATMEF